jgi:hypothetical protein
MVDFPFTDREWEIVCSGKPLESLPPDVREPLKRKLEDYLEAVEAWKASMNPARLRQLESEFAESLNALDPKVKDEWESRCGEGYPQDAREWLTQAVRAGVPIESLVSGTWAICDVKPFVVGYLQRLNDLQPDKKHDTKKNPEKKLRVMTPEARACVRNYKRLKKSEGKASMRAVVRDYVDENGGSEQSIMRTLSDHSREWKDDKNAT